MSTKLAVIFGSTGKLGYGIVTSFLAQGYTVALPLRDASKLHPGIKNRENVFEVEVPELNFDGMRQALRTILDRFGPTSINTVVASFGGMGRWGPVWQHDNDEEFNAIVERNKPHFLAWATFGRHLLEANRAGTSYIVITGAGGLMGSIGITSVGAAMQIGMARVAIYESKGTNLNVHEIQLAFLVQQDEEVEAAQAAGKAPPYLKGSSYFGRLVPLVANAPLLPADAPDSAHVVEASLPAFEGLVEKFRKYSA